MVTTEDAIKAKSFYTNPAPQKIQVGDAASKSSTVHISTYIHMCMPNTSDHHCLVIVYGIYKSLATLQLKCIRYSTIQLLVCAVGYHAISNLFIVGDQFLKLAWNSTEVW